MQQHRYKIVSSFFAAIYWLLDSTIHKFVFGEAAFEFFPMEANELWMRVAIIVLVFLMGAYADHSTAKLLKKEAEKQQVFRTTIKASHHILNNVIQALYLAKMEADSCQDFDRQVILMCEAMLADAAKQVKELDKIDDVSTETISDIAFPK